MKKIEKNTIKDVRGVFVSLNEKINIDEPMMNPVSWKLINKWEDGWNLKDDLFHGSTIQTLFKVEDNKIVEAYRLQPLILGKDLL